jgi:histidinol-phosphate aminotransferase
MTIEGYANRFVCDLVAYEPGKPIDETAREMGLRVEQIVKLASNENPLGPSPRAKEAMQRALNEAHLYPDGGGYRLRSAIAARTGLELGNVVIGNGSNEIIELLCHAFLNRETELVAARHAFVVYRLMATLFGARYVEVPDPGFVHDLEGMLAAVGPATRLVFVANPNNPTGTMVGQEAIDRFVEGLPEHVVAVFDEAYHEFLDDPPDVLKHVRAGRNVVVLRTCSKIHGLAALRVGYGLAPRGLAEVLHKARQPFNVNAVGQAGALGALDDSEHVARTRAVNRAGLGFWQAALRGRGIEHVPSVANFVLARVGDGDTVFRAMLRQGVIVRAMRAYELPEWVRISMGTREQNERGLEVLDEVLSGALA